VDAGRQRIDKWLWHARVVRTRTAAAALVASGHVRLNGERVTAASRSLKAGDVVTVALDRSVRVMQVAAFAERRGPPAAAQGLYHDLAPAPAPESAAAPRPGGGSRPTKKERRALDSWRREGDD
jgi:ribosome-associated heat shock protein Hsp15